MTTDDSDSVDLDIDEERAQIGAAFGLDADPLAEFAPTFEEEDFDPFSVFLRDELDSDNPADATWNEYERTFRQWSEVLESEGRHPACPAEEHVRAFINARREVGNKPRVIKGKLRRVNRAFHYWQRDPHFPHSDQFNPIESVRQKVDLSEENKKDPPRIPIDTLQDILDGITHIRDQAVVACQLKLGMRATELCNIELQDIHIQNAELLNSFPEMGTHPKLDGRQNAIWIPSRYKRDGNKSFRPRVLPIDDELQRALLRYLLIRPDNGERHLFLSQHRHEQVDRKAINRIWKRYFRPEYNETDTYAAVTSHFGRHRLSTFWRVEQDLNRELVKYMRGDIVGGETLDQSGAIDKYLHAYYEDVEELYRDRIYRLGI